MIEEFKELLRFNQLTEQDFQDAQITVEELQAIYNDYEVIKPQLEHEALYLAGLLSFCEKINSYRFRVKTSIGLLNKIIRKRKEKKPQYLDLTVNNYKEIITDIIGIRGIFVFKSDWEVIDNYICNHYELNPNENIIIYYVDGEDDLKYFKNKLGSNQLYKTDMKDSKYRSTHYIAKSQRFKGMSFEIQIRSILEEA